MNLENVTQAMEEKWVPQTEAWTEFLCLVDLLIMEALGLSPKF